MNLLKVKEVAAALEVSPSTVYKWVENNEIPYLKRPGLGVRFSQHAIDSWLEGNEVKPTPVPSLTFLPACSTSEPKGDKGVAKAKTNARLHIGLKQGAVFPRTTKGGEIRWYLDYWDESGRRIQRVAKNAATQEDALRALIDVVTAAKQRKQKEPIRATFSEFAKLYIESYAKVNKRSWACDNYTLEAHLKPRFGTMDLGAITALDIETYRVERLKAGVKKSSTNREMALLKKMYHLAMDWGYAVENPVLKIKLFSERDNLKERVLTEAEEAKLLAVCPAHLKPIVAFALNTGMRRGEILGLRWDQVDTKARTVRAVKTKSGRDRIIPLNDVAVDVLTLQRTKATGEYVFPSTRGCGRLKDVKKAFQSACRKAGITGLRFHDLRHTFASRLIQRGADIVTVQKLLGHFSVTMTERYTHSGADAKKAAVGLLVPKQDLWNICDMDSTKESSARLSRSNIIN